MSGQQKSLKKYCCDHRKIKGIIHYAEHQSINIFSVRILYVSCVNVKSNWKFFVISLSFFSEEAYNHKNKCVCCFAEVCICISVFIFVSPTSTFCVTLYRKSLVLRAIIINIASCFFDKLTMIDYKKHYVVTSIIDKTFRYSICLYLKFLDQLYYKFECFVVQGVVQSGSKLESGQYYFQSHSTRTIGLWHSYTLGMYIKFVIKCSFC